MKRKLTLFMISLITVLMISITVKADETVIQDSESPGMDCPWGYKSTSTWSGNCINCFCGTWNYTGRDSCT